jgi:hypothetical protein
MRLDGAVRSRRKDRGRVYLAVVPRKLDEKWLSPHAPHTHVRICISCLEWNCVWYDKFGPITGSRAR